MSNVLLIRSSIFGEGSKSLRLANEFLSRYPRASLVERGLSARRSRVPGNFGHHLHSFRRREHQR
jgi:hypothetical protein